MQWVVTRSLESKARKLVEERHCKNLGGDCRPKKKVKFKNTKTDRNNYTEGNIEVDRGKTNLKVATNRVDGGGGSMTEASGPTPEKNERGKGERVDP